MPAAVDPVLIDTKEAASLETIEYSKLQNRDVSELSRLLKLCQRDGFFYLSLENLEADISGVLENWEDVLTFTKEYFAQPVDVKMRDDRQSDTTGYKPLGAYAGVVPNSKDHYENLKMSRDEMRSHPPTPPASILAEMPLFSGFLSNCNTITQGILGHLSDAMNLTGESCFAATHREDKASRTNLIVFRYPQQDTLDSGIGHNKHTDLGTLTLLFTKQWGLQILSPSLKSWQYVAPKPRHAIVNVGDSLRFISGNALRSAVHRVFPVGGMQREMRYSIAYFLRPENDAIFRDSKGRSITAREWNDGKFKTFKQNHDLQEKDAILTGGMEMPEVAELMTLV